MNLLEIYKAKKLGRSTESLLASVLGNKPDVSYEWIKESVPYISRNTANGMEVTSLCKDKIVGGTIAWNQRVKNPNFNGITNWSSMRSSIVASNNVLTATADGTGFITAIGTLAPGIPNHKYLTMFDVNVSKENKTLKASLSDSSVNRNVVISSKTIPSANEWYTICALSSPETDEILRMRIGIDGLSNGDTMKLRKVNVIDLTEAFVSSIADYIYSLEQGTAGAGVAWFKALFGKDWYPFKESELMSVNVSAHVNRDVGDNIIGDYLLDETLTLRGIPKLDANNKLYYDGDTYEADGTVTRKYAYVDMGTLNWARDTSKANQVFRAEAPNAKATGDLYIRCSKYDYVGMMTFTNFGNNAANKTIGVQTNYGTIQIRDDSYSSSSAFKAAMSGVYCVYELASPVTESADAFSSVQIVDPSGTEEYVVTEQSGVAMPVGHETEYKVLAE